MRRRGERAGPERRGGRRSSRRGAPQLRAQQMATQTPIPAGEGGDARGHPAGSRRRAHRGSHRQAPRRVLQDHRHRGRDPRQVLAGLTPGAVPGYAGVQPHGGEGTITRQDGQRSRRRAHAPEAVQILPEPRVRKGNRATRARGHRQSPAGTTAGDARHPGHRHADRRRRGKR